MNSLKKISKVCLIGFVFLTLKLQSVFAADLNETLKDSSDPIEDIYAIVQSESGLKLRMSDSTDAQVTDILLQGDVMDVLEENGDWIKVALDGQVGYVSSGYIEMKQGPKPRKQSELEKKIEQIVQYGKQFLGTPYVYGGVDLNKGVDCSGFVYSVMHNNGVYVERNSRNQFYNGRLVPKSDLEPADLVFFDTSGPNDGEVSHVGIYIGDGQFIHSISNGVKVSNLSDAYYTRTYVSARRVVEA